MISFNYKKNDQDVILKTIKVLMAINVLRNYEFIVGNVIIVKCLLVNSWHNSLINFTNRLLMDWVQAL